MMHHYDAQFRTGKRRKSRRPLLVALLVMIIFGIGVYFGYNALFTRQVDPAQLSSKQSAPAVSMPPQITLPEFNEQRLPTDKAESIWTVVNKQRALNPIDYTPADLITPNISLRLSRDSSEMKMRAEAAIALGEMSKTAANAGNGIRLSSAYRSYQEQVDLLAYYTRTMGAEAAQQESAPGGHSEHQTGLAADVGPTSGGCNVQQCFGDTRTGIWVSENAYKYGFVVRYQKGKEAITGYIYEPWHLRYVGLELAKKLHDSGNPTLEEFFDLR